MSGPVLRAGARVGDAAESLEAAIERAIVAGAVRAIDRRTAALKADESGDAAAQARRAETARLLEDCATDIARMAGPFQPLQGELRLLPRSAAG